jgi:aldose 1-epimerase
MPPRSWYLRAMLGTLFAVAAFVDQAGADVKGPETFGKTNEGTPVEIFTLTNKNGMIAKVMTLGATLVELQVPDKDGKLANVVLGFDTPAEYQSDKNQYFGCTTGRVANRIAKGRFTLEGKDYQLAVNNGPNHLHGGTKRALAKVVWNAKAAGGTNGVAFTYTSPAGEESYPGTLAITVTYTLDDKNQLGIAYLAHTDKATPLSLTNHSYFNLAGAGSPTLLDHVLTIAADEYTPTDATQIPTGKIAPVAGTPLDFRQPTPLGAHIEPLLKTEALGYDHNFVLRKREDNAATFAATLRDPSSGRVMTVRTTQPALQLYTGNHLFGQQGKDGKTYAKRSAVCLETHHYPNAVNEPAFPSIILRPGETYRHTCIYAFSNE